MVAIQTLTLILARMLGFRSLDISQLQLATFNIIIVYHDGYLSLIYSGILYSGPLNCGLIIKWRVMKVEIATQLLTT